MIAAEKMEFSGLLRHLSGYRELQWPVGYAARATWTGGTVTGGAVTMVSNGPGPNLASDAFAAAFGNQRYDAVISTGFCGGLDPSLEVGSVVCANTVEAPETGRKFVSGELRTCPGAERGTILSLNRVAVSAAEKRSLRASGASAVEMEAAAVAAGAERERVPFYCVRVVSDAAGESLPLDFNLYRNREGRFDVRRIGLAALRNPLRIIPGLVSLRRNCALAAVRLGECLAGCRL